jgi:hypothetical protein
MQRKSSHRESCCSRLLPQFGAADTGARECSSKSHFRQQDLLDPQIAPAVRQLV